MTGIFQKMKVWTGESGCDLVDLRHHLSLIEITEQFQFDAVEAQRSSS